MTNKEMLIYFLECLEGIPNLHEKAMFGEYGIYSGDKMFALACDNTLFFKTYPETIGYFSDTKTKAYPGSRNTAPVNPEWLEGERDTLLNVAKKTLEFTKVTKKRKSGC